MSERPRGTDEWAASIGSVVGLWRYPIKSLDGEAKHELEFNERGVAFDRLWALVDEHGGIASGKHTRRFRRVPGLLRHTARMDGDVPEISSLTGAPRGSTPPKQTGW